MIAVLNENDRYENAFDDSTEVGGIERFTYRRGGAFPVRSSAARARARKRSRGGAAAKLKGRSFNGAHRRKLARAYEPTVPGIVDRQPLAWS